MCVCTLGVSPVEDLQYNFTSNNSLLITWSRPDYYSNDVPVGSPVSYQVLVTDEEDGDIILDTNTLNRNIEVYNVTECDTFNISVTALVDQYTSYNNTERNNGSMRYNNKLLILLFLDYSITEYDTQSLIPSLSFEVIFYLFSLIFIFYSLVVLHQNALFHSWMGILKLLILLLQLNI